MRYTKLFCLLLLTATFLFTPDDAFAQTRRSAKRTSRYRRNSSNRQATFAGRRLPFANAKQYITFGFSLNALNYFGDIVPKDRALSTDIAYTRPGLGISSTARLGKSFGLRAAFLYGRISSNDYAVADPSDDEAIYRYARNLQFRNNIKDLSLVGVYDFFPNPYTVSLRMRWTPYVFAGVSVFHHNPQGLVPDQAILTPDQVDNPFTPAEAGEWVKLKPLQTEGTSYSNFQLSIPFGGGVRFRISQLIDVEAEFSYRYLFTDYLDDVSGNYVDKGTLDSETAKIMSDRSLEPVDAVSGDTRVDVRERLGTSYTSYTGADGVEYAYLPGYGNAGDQRGDDDRDIFVTTSVRVVFMVGALNFRSRGYR